MLANPEMQVLPARVVRLEVSRALVFECGLVRRTQVRRAPQQPRDVLGEDVEDLPRSVAPGDSLRVGRKDGEMAIPTGRQFAPLHLIDLNCQLGKLGAVTRKEIGPPPVELIAALADARGKM